MLIGYGAVVINASQGRFVRQYGFCGQRVGLFVKRDCCFGMPAFILVEASADKQLDKELWEDGCHFFGLSVTAVAAFQLALDGVGDT